MAATCVIRPRAIRGLSRAPDHLDPARSPGPAGSSSYRRAEGETTEWEDILAAKGIIPAKEARRRWLRRGRATTQRAHAVRVLSAAPTPATTASHALSPAPQKPEVAEKRRADAEEARAEAAAAIDPLEGKSIAQLDELEVRDGASVSDGAFVS